MIITGVQRSGTKTFAHIMNLAHEQHYTSEQTIPNPRAHEVSWLAAPFIEHHLYVIVLIRNPINILNSILALDFWTDPDQKPYVDFIHKHLSLTQKEPLQLTQEYIINWHTKFLRPNKQQYPTIRIEDIQNCPKYHPITQIGRKPTEHTYDDTTEGFRKFAASYGYNI